MGDLVDSIINCQSNSTEMIGTYCNQTNDMVTCWTATPAGKVAKQPCPSIFGSPVGTFAYKRCGLDGRWAEPLLWKGFDYSDYSECIRHLSMIEEVFDIEKDKLREQEITTADVDDDSEHIAFITISLVSLSFLLLSFFIICCVIPTRLNRAPNYQVWRQLLLVVVFETLLKAILEILHITHKRDDVFEVSKLCEIINITNEYITTVRYLWLLILTHLQKLTAQSGRLCSSGYVTYILIGWGFPTIPVAIWSVTLALSYRVPCWHDYEFQPLVWVVETPRIVSVLLAVYFLFRAFSQMSKNSEILNTNCCYRRLYLETVGCSFIVVFTLVITISNVLFYQSSTSGRHVLNILCQVLVCINGTVLCMFMLCFNADVRGLLEKGVHRTSRQELVATPVEENEV